MSSRSELLHAYHDGELGALRRWQVRRWLARDASARRELEALAAVGAAVRSAQPAAPVPDLWGALEGRLRSIDAEREVQAARAGGLRLAALLRPAAAGAALAAVVAAVALFLRPGPDPALDAGAPSATGVVRWLDTRGKTVMVLDQGEATIIWLLQAEGDQAGREGGWLGII